MNVCYGCRYLVQSLGANGCVRFDHDGPQQGTMLRDDPPEPLYEDCYSTEARDSQVQELDMGCTEC